MHDDKTYLSKEKMKELKIELEELKTVKRKEIAEKLEYAKSLGDLSENAEYQEARESQGILEERIRSIEFSLKTAVVVSASKSDTVNVGSTVTIKKEGKAQKIEYKIVGSEEVNISEQKISTVSPMGMAMMGKKKGEKFTLKSPAGESIFTVVKIV